MAKKRKKKRVSRPKKQRKMLVPVYEKIHFNSIENVTGFVDETAKKGEIVKVLTRSSITSDNPLFYTYIEQITGIFLNKIFVNSVYQFLSLIHKDLSADLYLNNFPVRIEMMSKRDVKKGEVINHSDIADIGRLDFGNIVIKETDKVIYCFKVGWKFGLFFDLHREVNLDVKAMQVELGSLYRYLSFQYIYDIFDSKPHFAKLLNDGWFPFIGLLGRDFKEINDAYQNLDDPKTKIQEIISKFDKKKIDSISNKWWSNTIFSEKKQIIESGLNSYQRNDPDGFIACTKILLPEIEGIIRLHYFKETSKGKKVHIPELLDHLLEKGKLKTGSDYSLIFPLSFFNYLKEVIFPNFDLESGDIRLSRHTSSHGLAKPQEYTQERALQMILILDQIYFYL